jgi:hypothetical protein
MVFSIVRTVGRLLLLLLLSAPMTGKSLTGFRNVFGAVFVLLFLLVLSVGTSGRLFGS